MSKADLYQKLDKASEIILSVKGRKSGRDIPRPVWFVHEGNKAVNFVTIDVRGVVSIRRVLTISKLGLESQHVKSFWYLNQTRKDILRSLVTSFKFLRVTIDDMEEISYIGTMKTCAFEMCQ